MDNLLAIKRNFEEYLEYKHFNWYITKRCNYDCTYCSDMIHDNTSERPSLEKMQIAANNIFEHIPPSECFFDFSGGEPTVIPEFDIFLEWLKTEKNVNRVGFITNGTRNFSYYNKIMQYNDHITVSYHFEYANDATLVDKVVKLHEIYGKKIRVQIMYHAKYFERLKSIVAILKDNNIFYSIREIREKAASPGFDPAAMAYTNEMIEWMKDNEPKIASKMLGRALTANGEVEVPSGNHMIHHKLNNFKDWHCWIGLDYFQIWFDGTINRGGCGVGESLGNVYENIKWPSEPIKCTKDGCFCGPEIFTRKVSDLKYREWLNVSSKK